MDEIRKGVLLPDIQHPRHDPACIKAVIHKFIPWFKPHLVVILGDALNMDAINHWRREKDDKKYFEGKRLDKEYKSFDKEILTPIEKAIDKDTERVYLGGNHEDWANLVVNKEPNLEGLVEPEIRLRLTERGWKWIPYVSEDRDGNTVRGTYQVGKLLVSHGVYLNKFHTAKVAETHSKSCAYGHTHDIQIFSKIFEDDRGYHTAQSIGCLCNMSPDYMKGKPNKWVHGFGIIYVQPNGDYNLYVPVINHGRFVFAGEVFDGNK